jgi:hypothetical protein
MKIDKHDDSAFRNPYGRNSDMNIAYEFEQHIPFFLSREGAEIDLVGNYKGGSVFLICNGPSFVKLDHNKLKLPGVLTFGINNGPKTFRPNFWTSVDDPVRFLKSIWLDPKITKFVPQTFHEKPIFDNEKWEIMTTKVGECPNVVGYRRNEKFVAQRFLREPTINWGNHKDYGGGRSVMLASLRILHLLGFRTVYLLGCDMKMSENYTYHFDEQRSKGAINCNMSTYDRLKNEYLPALKPVFDEAGYKVFNCNPESELKVFPFVSFEDAIKETIKNLGDVPNERVWGMYSTPDEKSKWKQEATEDQKVHLKTLEALKAGAPTPIIVNSKMEKKIQDRQSNPNECSASGEVKVVSQNNPTPAQKPVAINPVIPSATESPIKWNPFNKVVLDHRNGAIDITATNTERIKRGLPTPWTSEMGEKEVRETPIF